MRADLTKRYRFSASHRLHSAVLTEDENWRTYGKCNNPHGHGHNYALHVTVSGPVDPETGMVLDLAVLDLVVGEEVIEPFDRTFLNIEAFRQTVPTTENLCMEIFRRLNARLMKEPSHGAARLKKVLLEETSLNCFEFEG